MASLRPSLKPSRVFPDGSWCKLLCLMSSTARQPCSPTGTSWVGAPVLLTYGMPSSFVFNIHNNGYWVFTIFPDTVHIFSHLILTLPPMLVPLLPPFYQWGNWLSYFLINFTSSTWLYYPSKQEYIIGKLKTLTHQSCPLCSPSS